MKDLCTLLVATFLLTSSLIGCGSPVVDPGRAPSRLPPPTAAPQPANPSALPALDTSEIQQVPTESVFHLPKDSPAATYHSVRAGETLTSIAKQFGVSAEKLRAANGLDVSAKLTADQLLFIPNDR